MDDFDRFAIKTMLLNIANVLRFAGTKDELFKMKTDYLRCIAQEAADIVNEREGKERKG